MEDGAPNGLIEDVADDCEADPNGFPNGLNAACGPEGLLTGAAMVIPAKHW